LTNEYDVLILDCYFTHDGVALKAADANKTFTTEVEDAHSRNTCEDTNGFVLFARMKNRIE